MSAGSSRNVDHVTCHLIDLPGAGSSPFTANTTITVAQQIQNVRRVVDLLGVIPSPSSVMTAAA